ncbi:MAG TPA: hypothetical protein VFK58_05295 [Sphingomicrobium sp.]|nr:hypothetical protein [Sphingomicrobium sp.]
MRALILVAGAALAVSACSSNDTADNTMNVDENLAAENIVVDNTMDANMDANMTMNADTNATVDANADVNADVNATTNNAM